MTQIVSDNFTRANSGSLGANWTVNNAVSLAEYTIASNIAVPSSASQDMGEVFTGASWTGGDDQYAEATLNATHADGAGIGSGVMCRSATAAATFYRLVGNASGYELVKAVAGSFTSLSSGTGTTFTAADVIRLELQGTTWRCKKNGTQFATGTDAAIASGSPGLGYSSASNSVANAAVKLWAAGDLSGGGSSPTLAQIESAMHRGMFRGMR